MKLASHYRADSAARRLVLISAIVSFAILISIAIFITRASIPAWGEVGFVDIVLNAKWYPGRGDFGILTMLAGSAVATLLALAIAVPLSLGTAIFLAEVAPPRVRNFVKPAIELLVGIPSVVYGLVGVIFLTPIIADISGHGSGSSILAAGVILAIMILPTVASISEDSLRAVPKQYKEGALSLGATHWQAIRHVMLPAARRGIVAGIVLGLGRAIGETMAMVMVIGNSPIFPTSIFSPARTLTGNIAVEIAAATGIHESALFATGLVLFLLVIGINSVGLTIAYRGNNRA